MVFRVIIDDLATVRDWGHGEPGVTFHEMKCAASRAWASGRSEGSNDCKMLYFPGPGFLSSQIGLALLLFRKHRKLL